MACIAAKAVERAINAERDGATFLAQLRQATRRLVTYPELKIGCGAPDHPRARLHDQCNVIIIHHIHMNEAGILAENADFGEMADARLAEALAIGAGRGGDVPLMLLEDDAGLVSKLLRSTEQRIGCGSQSINRNIAAHERIGILVAVQLAAELIKTTFELRVAHGHTGSDFRATPDVS